MAMISDPIGQSVSVRRTESRRGPLAQIVRFAQRKPLGAVGFVILLVFTIAAIFAPQLAPYDPYLIDSAKVFIPPGLQHLMGTDEFGRDVFSRVIYGSRVSLTVGFFAVGLGVTLGSLVGLVGGYFGGWIDYATQRVVDVLMAFPLLVLALAMVAALGAHMVNVIIALAIVIAPNAARVIRSTALSVREKPYVEAAQNLGFSHWRILFRHVLPNCVAPFIILVTAGLGSAILTEATLSFLGLGTPPPEPSWGMMLSGKAQTYITRAPWLAVFPGLAVSCVVFGSNFLGDALRDVLDPRLRQQ